MGDRRRGREDERLPLGGAAQAAQRSHSRMRRRRHQHQVRVPQLEHEPETFVLQNLFQAKLAPRSVWI